MSSLWLSLGSLPSLLSPSPPHVNVQHLSLYSWLVLVIQINSIPQYPQTSLHVFLYPWPKWKPSPFTHLWLHYRMLNCSRHHLPIWYNTYCYPPPPPPLNPNMWLCTLSGICDPARDARPAQQRQLPSTSGLPPPPPPPPKMQGHSTCEYGKQTRST